MWRSGGHVKHCGRRRPKSRRRKKRGGRPRGFCRRSSNCWRRRSGRWVAPRSSGRQLKPCRKPWLSAGGEVRAALSRAERAEAERIAKGEVDRAVSLDGAPRGYRLDRLVQ